VAPSGKKKVLVRCAPCGDMSRFALLMTWICDGGAEGAWHMQGKGRWVYMHAEEGGTAWGWVVQGWIGVTQSLFGYAIKQ
jgi:hypothetical protein